MNCQNQCPACQSRQENTLSPEAALAQKVQSLELEAAALRERVRELYAENAEIKKEYSFLKTESESLKEQIQDTDDLLDDIAAFRAAQISVKAIVEDVIATLTDKTLTDEDIDEAVRLLRNVRDF